MRWIDAEVHLVHPGNRLPGRRAPEPETRMNRAIFDHVEGELALARADVQALLGEMDAGGIERACIMGMPWVDPGRCELDNHYVGQCVRSWPERFLGFGVLAAPSLSDPVLQVRRMALEHGFLGVKVIPSWQGWRLTDRDFEPALREMSDLGLTLVPHTDHLTIDPAGADTAHALLETARRFPDLKILAPHLGGLLCLYELISGIKADLGNLLFVTSVSRSMGMVEFAARAAGCRRLAFGTDYPFNVGHDQRSVKQALEGLNFPPGDLVGIAGKNLERFLGLTGGGS